MEMAADDFLPGADLTVLMDGIVEYSRLVWSRGLVDGNGGNLSVKVSDNLYMVTPTMFSKRDVTVSDLCFVDGNGVMVEELMRRYGQSAGIRPTSEFATHLAVYRADPSAMAIVHTHPPYTCSYAFTDAVPAQALSPESAIWMGELQMVPYAPAGSEELASSVERNAAGRNVLVLQNHGLIAWGRNLKEAFWRTEVVESHCRICSIMESRGAVARNFTPEEKEGLVLMRRKFLGGK